MGNMISLDQFKTSEQLRGAIQASEMWGMPVPQEWRNRLVELERQEAEEKLTVSSVSAVNSDDIFVHSATPIYDTLVKESKFKPSEEKRKCIFETVDSLLVNTSDPENDRQPGLLLGRIQCGKTDTFVKIMALAFDKGIDVAVVFTKGTNALAEQTRIRMAEEFEIFESESGFTERPVVSVYDIMDIRSEGLTRNEVNHHKNIIICKKEDDNLKHLVRLFKKITPLLGEKKVLIVDDEADFASWNYMKRHGEIRLAVITKLIKEFIETPKFCRYLQVTATPYSLYLQPDQSIEIEEDGFVRPMKPRFTTIVPTHDQYVGGDHYFIKSLDEESMYSYLFHPISEDCLQVMKKQNGRYLTNMLTSNKIREFRYAILSYLIATVIRRIQEIKAYASKHPGQTFASDDERFDEIYKSSCLIHLQVAQRNHVWQETLVLDLIKKIKEAYCESNDTSFFDELFDEIYNDFSASNRAAREYDKLIEAEMPSHADVKRALVEALNNVEPKEIVHVVNSNKGIGELLDKKSGQLKLKSVFNIFIGGSILDRGITINNMLGFFYGRTPKTYQQDTVLQHMRQYGSRSKEDMAVTRMHTTYELHSIVESMNRLDNQLRNWLINESNSDPDMKAVFVGLSPNSKIVPCAKGKCIVSNTVTITPGTRLTTAGFQTGPKSSISKAIQSIDERLAELPNYKEDDFFEVDKHLMYDIIRDIRDTYVYDDEPGRQWGNFGFDWNCDDMIGLLEYCTGNGQDTVHCMVRTGMNMSRKRSNGRFIDAPETGRTDGDKARRTAIDKPAIILFREEGSVEKGWRGTPFYWPVAYASQNLKPVVFTAGSEMPEFNVADINMDKLLEGVNPEQVLHIQCQNTKFDDIELGQEEELTRAISEISASKLLVPALVGYDYEVNPSAVKDESTLDAGIHSYNNGVFPFLLRDYTHVLLWCKSGSTYKYMLASIKSLTVRPGEEDMVENDTLIFPSGDEIAVTYDNFVTWCITYKLKKVKTENFQATTKRRRA